MLCFEWYASLIKVRLRFIVLFFFFFFVVRGRREEDELREIDFIFQNLASLIRDTKDKKHHHHHHHRARQSPRASHLTAKQPHDDAQTCFFTPRRFPLFFLRKRWFLRAVVLLLFCFRHHHHRVSNNEACYVSATAYFAFFSRKIKERKGLEKKERKEHNTLLLTPNERFLTSPENEWSAIQ